MVVAALSQQASSAAANPVLALAQAAPLVTRGVFGERDPVARRQTTAPRHLAFGSDQAGPAPSQKAPVWPSSAESAGRFR
jgi:hypothetical protein